MCNRCQRFRNPWVSCFCWPADAIPPIHTAISGGVSYFPLSHCISEGEAPISRRKAAAITPTITIEKSDVCNTPNHIICTRPGFIIKGSTSVDACSRTRLLPESSFSIGKFTILNSSLKRLLDNRPVQSIIVASQEGVFPALGSLFCDYFGVKNPSKLFLWMSWFDSCLLFIIQQPIRPFLNVDELWRAWVTNYIEGALIRSHQNENMAANHAELAIGANNMLFLIV